MATPEQISLADFFSPPTRTEATISPDGARIAYLAPWRNHLNVWVRSADSDGDARCVTADDTRSVIDYQWTDDPRWLLYNQDNGGDELAHLPRRSGRSVGTRGRPHPGPRGQNVFRNARRPPRKGDGRHEQADAGTR